MTYENFKAFSKQFRECREDGTAFDEKTHCCGKIIIMCKRFGGQCSAAKCRGARLKKADESYERLVSYLDLNEGC